jgi:hypothetical protein
MSLLSDILSCFQDNQSLLFLFNSSVLSREATNILIKYLYIYNIRTLSVNIKFICTSFRNRQNSKLFRPVSQQVQMNFIFKDNVPILCLSCNVKKVRKLVRFIVSPLSIMYKYAIRINLCFIRTRRINFSAYE